jgi:hypothetical protein
MSNRNRLHKARISTLAEIREQDTARIAISVITNESHPLRSYFMNNTVHDEYAIKPRTIKLIFSRSNTLLFKTTVEEGPIRTNRTILMQNPKGIKVASDSVEKH